MSSRARVLQLLSQRVGFQFNEAELSPSLRQKIGELANTRQRLDEGQTWIEAKQAEVVSGGYQESKYGTRSILGWIFGGLLLAFGALGAAVEASLGTIGGFLIYMILFVTPGLILLLYGTVKYLGAKDTATRSQKATREIKKARENMDKINATFLPQVTIVSQQIMAELSTMHEARIHPTIPQGPQIVKETVLKEVVMIPCSYCKGLMPQTSMFCPHCGAQRKG